MSTTRKPLGLLTAEEISVYAEVYEKGRVVQISKAREQGPKNLIGARKRLVELGWYEELGRRRVESGQIQALGRIQGPKNVENGHLARARQLVNRDCQKAAARISGTRIGKAALESGQLASIQTAENQSKGRHVRWHIRREIFDPNCSLCLNGGIHA